MKQDDLKKFRKSRLLRWCALYHLLVGICGNGYPLAHIHTDKWYMVYTIALYSTVKCDGAGCIIYQKVYLRRG